MTLDPAIHAVLHAYIHTLWVGFELIITVAGLLLMLCGFGYCIINGIFGGEK